MLSKLGGADAHFHFFKYPPKIHGSGRTLIVVLPIQQKDSISVKLGYQRNCKERLLVGKEKMIREASEQALLTALAITNISLAYKKEKVTPTLRITIAYCVGVTLTG